MKSLYEQLKADKITFARYTELKSILNTLTFSEGLDGGASARKRFTAIRNAMTDPSTFALGSID